MIFFNKMYDLTKLFFLVPVCGLSNLQLQIPAIVLKGQSPQFECSFNLESDTLYAIKWYRGNYEIFRYLPSEFPQTKTFPLLGYNICVKVTFF